MSEQRDLEDVTALVTGATSGIGRAAAEQFAAGIALLTLAINIAAIQVRRADLTGAQQPVPAAVAPRASGGMTAPMLIASRAVMRTGRPLVRAARSSARTSVSRVNLGASQRE
jgi:NAD(P)-dependent dehydrogenase (short-subunit alcohol dehydrogenase family)